MFSYSFTSDFSRLAEIFCQKPDLMCKVSNKKEIFSVLITISNDLCVDTMCVKSYTTNRCAGIFIFLWGCEGEKLFS